MAYTEIELRRSLFLHRLLQFFIILWIGEAIVFALWIAGVLV